MYRLLRAIYQVTHQIRAPASLIPYNPCQIVEPSRDFALSYVESVILSCSIDRDKGLIGLLK